MRQHCHPIPFRIAYTILLEQCLYFLSDDISSKQTKYRYMIVVPKQKRNGQNIVLQDFFKTADTTACSSSNNNSICNEFDMDVFWVMCMHRKYDKQSNAHLFLSFQESIFKFDGMLTCIQYKVNGDQNFRNKETKFQANISMPTMWSRRVLSVFENFWGLNPN